MSDKKTYKIGTISIDADGVWWVHWAGTYLDGEDLTFGPRNIGNYNLDHALKIVGMNLRKCRELYVDQIKALEAAKIEEPKE